MGTSFQFQRQGSGPFWGLGGSEGRCSGKRSGSLDACASDRNEPLLYNRGQDSVSPLGLGLLIL